MTKKHHKPDWVPENAGKEFTTSVMAGVDGGHDGIPGQSSVAVPLKNKPRRRQLTIDEYVAGVLAGDRNVLGQAITLVESNAQAHFDMGQEVLRQLLSHTGNSIRVGITGVPGGGKSTFIEALGLHLCAQGHKVAVLAVDPSSTVTRGSILGDKTRMELLSRDLRAFIRPSPSGGTLGGVARKSRETILVCEAAGFDVILVETVGVGQSETTVRSMVDFFLLLMIAGAGDELQGIKKGIMELADALLVNKADGDNKNSRQRRPRRLQSSVTLPCPGHRGLAHQSLHLLRSQRRRHRRHLESDRRLPPARHHQRRVREAPTATSPGLGILDGRGTPAC